MPAFAVPARLLFLTSAVVAAGAMLGACSPQAGASTEQAAFKINGEPVSEHQLELVLPRGAIGDSDAQSQAAGRQAVAGLVQESLAAQAARKAGLDRDPRTVQMIEAAQREVLARAYEERLAGTAVEPSSDEIDQFYEAHPAWFAQRKLMWLQEAVLPLPAARIDALKARLQAATTPDKTMEALRVEGVPLNARQFALQPEETPQALLDGLAALRVGQSLVLPQDGGVRVLTVLQTQSAAVSRSAAVKQIAALIRGERRRKAVERGLAALQQQAKVEYIGRSMQWSAAASAPLLR